MAKNGEKGGGRRGSVNERTQFLNQRTNSWIKRDVVTGIILDNKTSGGRFKGVRREK